MSSILKALRKLESEKSQRDELSTAVASDILRSSRGRQHHVILRIVMAAVVVSLCAVGGYLFAIHTRTVQTTPAANTPGAFSPPAAESRAVVADLPSSSASVLPPDRMIPRDLPRLSGIIYQPEPQDRLAIINDLPVMEGTLVADYEIKAIQPDRVVLVRSGSEFVLYLEQ